MDLDKAYIDLATTAAIGLLAGLQRERSGSAIAGIRTFALVAIFGSVAAMLAPTLGGWVVAAGLLAVAVLAYVGNMTRPPSAESPGVTTEIALLVIYAVGAMIVLGPRTPAIAAGAATAVLLQLKPTLQQMARRLGDRDMRAIMQFAAISLIVLPALPDKSYGPYGGLNPRHIWLMVVLVSGISMLGYAALRVLGGHGGAILSGFLGGLVSSTATTVTFAKRVPLAPAGVGVATLAITTSSMVLYIRVLVEVYAAAGGAFTQIAPPIVILLGISMIACLLTLSTADTRAVETVAPVNPAELRTALLFAAIYAVVTLATAAANDQFGRSGAFAVAAISGMTDMDAITLSSARQVSNGTMALDVATHSILIALASNLVFKTALAAVIGGRVLGARVALILGSQAAAAIVLIFAWPLRD